MTDSNTDSAPAQTAKTPHTASTTTASKRNTKNRLRRKARRRDGADSDDEDAGGASDASSASSAVMKPKLAPKAKATPPIPAKRTPAPLFPGHDMTTPAAWADMTDKGDEITFDEFTRNNNTPARGGRGGAVAVRGGLGRGAKVAITREPRELTDERKRREEEKAAHRRQKLKAKRKAKKEAERQGKAAAKVGSTPAAPPATLPSTATAATGDADSSLAASTSALKLDDPSPNAPESPSDTTSASAADPPRTNRNAYTQRVAEDPKFTPRVGNFWMHDQRHYEAGSVGEGSFGGLRGMSDYWRGRGGMRGMPRGGFRGVPSPRGGRGRGRGFGFVPPIRSHSPNVSAPPSISASTTTSAPARTPTSGTLPRPASAVPASVPAPAPAAHTNSSNNGHRMAEMDKLEIELAQRARNNHLASGERKWGHEGFEEFAAHDDPMRVHRIARGRGRGRGGFARGGGPGVLRGVIPASVAHLPTPEASPDRSASTSKDAGSTTQPTVETLLEDSGSVTVKLPGGAQSVDVDRPPSQPTDDHTKSPFPPAFTPSNPSPVPYVASDSGSISSGYIPPSTAPHQLAEFYGMPSGAQAPALRPAGGGPGAQAFYPHANYRPQSFTPEPHFVPHHQARGSFSGSSFTGAQAQPFYPGAPAHNARPGSPLNPYAAPAQGQMGFFVPPRPSKVSIRSPQGGEEALKSPSSSDGAEAGHMASGAPVGAPGHATPEFVPAGFYQPYNPYAEQQQVYYPQQGYWPQQYDGGAEYAYAADGQYHGY